MECCGHCGRRRNTIHWSDNAKAWLCYECYFKLPSSWWLGPKPKVYRSPPRPTLHPYTVFVREWWDKLEARTGRVWYIGAREIASYCPACLKGTMLVTFVDGHPPRAIPSSQAYGVGMCSWGCTTDQIGAAMRAVKP